MSDTEPGATREVAPFVRAAKTGQDAETTGPIESLYPTLEKLGRAHNDACLATMAAEERYVAPDVPRTKGGALLKVDDAGVEEMKALISEPFDPTKSEPENVAWDRHFHAQQVERTKEHLAIVETYRHECRRRADAAGLIAAQKAEEAASIPAQAIATALLEMEPTTFREAAFQAAIIECDCYTDQDVDPFRLAKRMVELAGIRLYWLPQT